MSDKKIVSRIVLELERVFDAPPALVFQAFKEAEHLMKWWGPRGWDLPVCKVDFRPGGVWHYCMKCVDENQGSFYGMESWGKAIYKEIDEPNKVVYTDYFSDAEGTENPDLPSTDVTMEFIGVDGKTKLISRGVYASVDALKTVIDMGMMEGVGQTWDRLDEHLADLQKTSK